MNRSPSREVRVVRVQLLTVVGVGEVVTTLVPGISSLGVDRSLVAFWVRPMPVRTAHLAVTEEVVTHVPWLAKSGHTGVTQEL